MSEQNTGDRTSAAVPLRDGGELRVDAEGVHVRETRYGLEQIQDARQVSPDPETIGLRVEDVGLISVVPVRVGDAAVALDALYRLRPDLRPAGWALPTYWPSAYGPPPGYAPPPGYPLWPYAGAPLYPGYAIVPGTPVRRGGLAPWPQSIGDVLGTIFRLYFENFWRFFRLGLALA